MVSVEGKLTKIAIVEDDDSEDDNVMTEEERKSNSRIERKGDLLNIPSEKEARDSIIEERFSLRKSETSITSNMNNKNSKSEDDVAASNASPKDGTESVSSKSNANTVNTKGKGNKEIYEKPVPKASVETKGIEEEASLMDQMLKDCLKAKQQAKKVKEVKEMAEAKTSSGMKTIKKGFLSKLNNTTKENDKKNKTTAEKKEKERGSDNIETLTINKSASKDMKTKLVEDVGKLTKSDTDGKPQNESETSSNEESNNDGSLLSQLSKNKDTWMTPELLQKIAGNEVVKNGFTDPECQQALSMLQVSPHQAMMHYKDNPKVTKFLIATSEILGKHFQKMGEEEEEKKKKELERQFEKEMESKGPLMKKAFEKQFKKAFSSEKKKKEMETNTKIIEGTSDNRTLNINRNSYTKDEQMPTKSKPKITEVTKEMLVEDEQQKKVNEILANDELKSILLDPQIQTILMNCSESGKLQYYMKHEVYGPKIQKLLENGLVQIEK